MSMKVLVFIERAEPSRYWEAAVPLLRDEGIDVAFVTLRPRGPLSDAIEGKGISAYSLGAVTAKDYPLATIRLASLVRREKFDIIHACESIPAAISGVSRVVSAEALRLFHRQHNACPQKTRLFHLLANKLSHKTMTCSAATRDFACDIDGVDRRNVSVAYSGIVPLVDVPPKVVAEMRTKLSIPADAKVVSLVARLHEGKGHLTLISAAERVAHAVPYPIHLVFAGSGDYEPIIRENAARAKDITIHFTGHQEDIAPWFAVGDIAAMPTYAEAFGIVAVEAMSSGKPLIASGVDGLLEVVEDGISGLLVPPRDVDALADAMIRVITSPELAASLAAGGQKRVTERFTMEKMVEGWIDCYNWALAGE